MNTQDILLIKQRHDADRAGTHWDWRVVIGDKAYSWATKKQTPNTGGKLILWEQPVHTKDYALAKEIVIPKGQYGAGVTRMEYAQKGTAKIKDNDYYELNLNNGDRYYIKKMPSYGDKAWLLVDFTGREKRANEVIDAPIEQEHQNRVLRKIKSTHPNLLAFHGLGSGKTLTGLRAAQQALQDNKKQKVRFITPASLTKNITKEQKKHKIKLDSKRVEILSYDKAVRQIDKLLEDPSSLNVIDEAHKLRDEDTVRFQQLKPFLDKSKSNLLLSGSPSYNSPKNMSTLVNLMAKEKVLPEDEKEFEEKFINKKKVDPGIIKRLFLRVKPSSRSELKNQEMLRNILDQYVDYYEPDEQAKAFYPKVEEETVKTPMSKEQQRIYDYLEGKMPGALKWKVRMGLPADKKESKQLNAFASGLRQVSNSHGPFVKNSTPEKSISPKIETAVSRLASKMGTDKNFRGLVYSNYLQAGLDPYEASLKKLGIPYQKITGSLSAKEKDKIVKNYNAGKSPVLLISSSGGEGLDLKGVKLIQVLEPHFNKEKIKQVIGRGVRYKSHLHLPPEEQKVNVEFFHSTVKQTLTDKLFKVNPKSIDEYLTDRMNEKEEINRQIGELLNGKKNKK